MNKHKVGWGIQGFLVFTLLCGLSVPLGLALAWWASVAFVCGVLGLLGLIMLSQWLIDSK